MEILTDADAEPADFSAHVAEHQFTRVVNPVHLWVPQLKAPNNIIGPGAYGSNGTDADDAGDQAERVENLGKGEDAEAKLGLHHRRHCSYPSDLSEDVRDVSLRPSRVAYISVIRAYLSGFTKHCVLGNGRIFRLSLLYRVLIRVAVLDHVRNLIF